MFEIRNRKNKVKSNFFINLHIVLIWFIVLIFFHILFGSVYIYLSVLFVQNFFSNLLVFFKSLLQNILVICIFFQGIHVMVLRIIAAVEKVCYFLFFAFPTNRISKIFDKIFLYPAAIGALPLGSFLKECPPCAFLLL